MNWYKKNIKTAANYGEDFFHSQGSWQYPFSLIKNDSENGWHINWFEEQGQIPDIENVQPGDKISDVALNTSPYWEVSDVDPDTGIIKVSPLSNNPFLSGVGSGGKEITDHDMRAFTGEKDRELVDFSLSKIKQKNVYSPSDIYYILKGTVPVQFGPNGSQGGWYNIFDNFNRGRISGNSVQQIMVADALTLKKLGLEVPMNAIDGSLDPELWNNFVNGSWMTPEKMEKTAVEGENFNDFNSCINMLKTSESPVIKSRNFSQAVRLMSNEKNEMVLGNMKNALKEEMIKFVQTVPGNYEKTQFDIYYLVKEQMIDFAATMGWNDVLKEFENSPDPDNVKYTLMNYEKSLPEQEYINKLLSKEKTEKSPKVLSFILHKLKDYDIDISEIIKNNPIYSYYLSLPEDTESMEGYQIYDLSKLISRYIK